jgi:NAD(P)-dependent dehydrogenase (short-subunit alcohol dehydrogenase family)
MDLGIAGQRALITGGSKGIGRAIAESLAAEGCDLHLVARSRDDLEAARDSIRARWNVDVAVHAVDLGAPGACENLAEQVKPLDILVNNAGAIPAGDLLSIDDDRWRKAWDLKVFGFINLSRAVYGDMKQRKRGVIVNVMGGAGERPDAAFVVGSTGNAALMALTRALGGRSLDDGIRVVGVNPGMVATERMRSLLESRAQKTYGDASRWQEFISALPLGRGAAPREVADAVVFLASDRASYISGTVLTIDGGTTNRR